MNMFVLICHLAVSGVGPQVFLQLGEDAMRAGDWPAASFNFKEAIKTGYLNEAGLAISYWNIHVAEDKLSNTDDSMYALLAFTVYGKDYLDSESYNDIGKKSFSLTNKLDYASTMLQAEWASRNNYSCREKIFACPISGDRMIGLFHTKIPFCKGSVVSKVSGEKEDPFLKLNIGCSNGLHETYYFIK